MFGLGIVNSFGIGSNDDYSSAGESMLLRLMQAAAASTAKNNDEKKTVHWNHVLQYMKDHCDILQQQQQADDDVGRAVLPYPSPFHAHYGANVSLQQEYMHHRVSIWSCALSNAPIAVVSALCHVIPSHLW